MTKKETLEFIKETLAALPNSDSVVAGIEYCDNELESLEKQRARNDKRRAEKAAENQEYFDKLIEELQKAEEGLTASEGAEILGVSTQKASSLFRSLMTDGKVNQTDKKIPKKGSCKVYTIA